MTLAKPAKAVDLQLTAAFQPIANIYTGQCLGYEILARPDPHSGVADIRAIFDAHHAQGTLADLEIAVRRSAALKAARLPAIRHRLLFANLDCRLGAESATVARTGRELLAPHAAEIVSEIDGYEGPAATAAAWVRQLRGPEAMVALDRFASSGSGLVLLQHCEFDFLKIDRTFIENIDTVSRKRVVLSQLVNTAHTLGIEVIAVGVETARELTVCRELGCDLVQGFFLQPPVLDPAEAGTHFAQIEASARRNRSRRQIDHKWIADQLDKTPPVMVDTVMTEVFARVAKDPNQTVIPVIDRPGQPIGVLRERDLRNYAYSAFGKDLIANRSLGLTLRNFMERCPIADINTPLDQLLAIYSTEEDADGILIAEQMGYCGFLSARSLIRAMHEKTLARARDENPLTKLPGNAVIDDYVSKLLLRGECGVLAYIDFDNFKPFNDTYGFRQGDRAILLFAELMRKAATPATWFLGHIGGDDFFIGMSRTAIADAQAAIGGLIAKFTSDAESFYDTEARRRGHIIAQDRDGHKKSFPLLSASAVLLEVTDRCATRTVDDVSAAIALRKKDAKASPAKIALAQIDSVSQILG